MKRVLFAAGLTASFASCTTIDSSEVGIIFSKFGLTDKGEVKAEYVSGWTIYNPISTSVFTYPTYTQRCDYDAFKVTTSDAAEFSIDPMLAYKIDRTKAIYIFTKYRLGVKDIEQGYMRTAIYDAYRIAANVYTSDELMANRAKFESEVKDILNNSLIKEGFIIEEFTSQIVPPQSLQRAIEAKNEATQLALKADNEVKTANANANIAIAKAQGEATAMKIKADAEAYSNRVIAASITPTLVEMKKVQQWDGKVPVVSGGSNLVDLKGLK